MDSILGALDWSLYLTHLRDLVIAFLIALPIGWDRERYTHSAGLRTFPLVAVASCGYMLIGQTVVGSDPEPIARLMYGLMTGIGFIGGGAILKDGSNVHGTATAASVWTTGAIGMAVAFGRYEIAVFLALLNLVILRLVAPLKDKVGR